MDSTIRTGWIPALIIGSALVFSGWAVGQGVEGFRAADRTVTVNGLTNLDVKNDFAVWTLAFRRDSDKLAEVRRSLKLDRDRIVIFLREKGFRADEIEVHPLQVEDLPGREASSQQAGQHFNGQGRVLVKTTRVDTVLRVAGQIDPLIAAGIQFESEPRPAPAAALRR
ncbi:SIMPL domain-containing protein [Azorhizophilus paspali]|uniref:SIMPL domain-containing protein n=1 Tax=Azorhizophilus paspali TaxID=69963 RepID=A0ABV6SMK3_AZOPA